MAILGVNLRNQPLPTGAGLGMLPRSLPRLFPKPFAVEGAAGGEAFEVVEVAGGEVGAGFGGGANFCNVSAAFFGGAFALGGETAADADLLEAASCGGREGLRLPEVGRSGVEAAMSASVVSSPSPLLPLC